MSDDQAQFYPLWNGEIEIENKMIKAQSVRLWRLLQPRQVYFIKDHNKQNQIRATRSSFPATLLALWFYQWRKKMPAFSLGA